MRYRLTDAQYMGGYVLKLKFSDGIEGEIDLAKELQGPMFEPLNDPDTFRRFRLDPELHNIIWPNGADFAPEFLHDNLRVTA